MAFRNKAQFAAHYKPDILIVPECENPDKLKYKEPEHCPTNAVWFGENPNKGLGIFSYTGLNLNVLNIHNSAFKMVVPVTASDHNSAFTVFAVWANNPADKDGQYVTQVWKAIHYYKDLLENDNVILAGDFNSNTIWDRPSRKGNHSDVVAMLAGKGIHSVYHKYFKQPHGQEKHPTHYLYRHRDKPYHLDYCFVSANLLKRLKTVEVGNFADWSAYSDHAPVMATFSRPRKKIKASIFKP